MARNFDLPTAHLMMGQMLNNSTGLSFVLLMEQPRRRNLGSTAPPDYSFHPRFNQPCFGELRKYESTHPKDCTQPENGKPGDLHWPFPDGRPVSLAIQIPRYNGLNPSEERTTFLKGFFENPLNPWLSGFLGAKNVELFLDKSGEVTGFLLKSLAFDPTVFVNMMFFLSDLGGKSLKDIEKLKSLGLTDNEAYLFLVLNNHGIDEIYQSNSYHFAERTDPKKFLSGTPNDLTGGTLADRFDYNRTDIHDVFATDDLPTWDRFARDTLGLPPKDPMNWTPNPNLTDDDIVRLVEALRKVATR